MLIPMIRGQIFLIMSLHPWKKALIEHRILKIAPSHVEFLQSCLERAKSIFSPKEKMQFVVEFIDYQKMHTKNELARTHTYLEKTMINLFHKTVDKLRLLSGKIIRFSEKMEEKLGRTIDRQNKFLFGN